MPESTRKRSAAKAAAEPEPAPAKKPSKAAKSAKAGGPAVEQPVADEGAGTGEDGEFLNRAARRAKGRGRAGGSQPVTGNGPSYSSRGSVPGQRQWGNRRTGG